MILLPSGRDNQKPLYMHLVMQVCDSKSYQNQPRVCGQDRTALSKKSLRSWFNSIVKCYHRRPAVRIHAHMIYDQITPDLLDYCVYLADYFAQDRITVTLQDLAPEQGIAASICRCYQWLRDNGQHVVAQYQDDYLFTTDAIDHSVAMLLQLQTDSDTDAVINAYHNAAFWKELYHNSSTPRGMFLSPTDFWIQIYDLSCTFMTTYLQFNQHWDLYETFFWLCDNRSSDQGLESASLNLMTIRRGVLAVQPMKTLSHHVQSARELFPYADWRTVWDNIDVDIPKS